MFPSSVIRKLANSEEMLAETHNFVGLAAHVKGPVDIDALSAAYDALLEARPVLTARLERGPDGRHQIVADDLLPAGIEVVELDGPDGRRPPTAFRPERVARAPSSDHSRRTGAPDPLRPSQPRRRSSHVQPHRGTAFLLHRDGRQRNHPRGHRRARAGADRDCARRTGDTEAEALGDRAIHACDVRLRSSAIPASYHRRQTYFAPARSDGVVPTERTPHRQHRCALSCAWARLDLRAVCRCPYGGVATSRLTEHSGSVDLHGRSAVLPLTAGVGDRVHQPGRVGDLPRRDRPQDTVWSTSPATSPRPSSQNWPKV